MIEQLLVYKWSILATIIGCILVWRKSAEIRKKTSTDGEQNVTDKVANTKAAPNRHEKHPQHASKESLKQSNTKQIPSISKGPNLRIIEFLQYGINISAAFVGLSVTFILNSQKTQNDKKQHLISILTRYEQNQTMYSQFLDKTGATAQSFGDTIAGAQFLVSHKNQNYPFLINIYDPVIFDLSPPSAFVLSNMDYQVKGILDGNLTKKNAISYTHLIKDYLDISQQQIDLELNYLNGNIDAATLNISSLDLYKKFDSKPHTP